MRLAGLLLLAVCAACGERIPDGQRRELVSHWPARPGREALVRALGQEVSSGGQWRKHGEFLFYDEQGNQIGGGSYRDGLEHGPWSQVEENGHVGRGSFIAGKREGKWTYSYENGEPEEEGPYVGGTRQGQWIQWYSNGDVAAELMYSDGELHGMCSYINGDGTPDLVRSGRYARGKKL